MATQLRNSKPDSYRAPSKITRFPSPTESEKPKAKANLTLLVSGQRYQYYLGLLYTADEEQQGVREEFVPLWMKRAFSKGQPQWLNELSIKHRTFYVLQHVLVEAEACALEYEQSCEDELVDAVTNAHTYLKPSHYSRAQHHMPDYTPVAVEEQHEDWLDLIDF